MAGRVAITCCMWFWTDIAVADSAQLRPGVFGLRRAPISGTPSHIRNHSQPQPHTPTYNTSKIRIEKGARIQHLRVALSGPGEFQPLHSFTE